MNGCIMSRTEQSIKNIISGLMSQIVLAIITLFTTKIIKENLGFEYLGLNGVFTNIISFLNLTELGIGSAIVFALYKPLAERNEDMIVSLMHFYKKAYYVIASIILILGLLLLPFIPKIVKSDLPNKYTVFVYLLFLLNTVTSYLFTYKQSLITADQKNYIITTYTMFFSIFSKMLQLIVVIVWKNYILFLLVNIISLFLLNFFLSRKTDKLYPYLRYLEKKDLPKESRKLIFNKTKAMFLHSIGYFVISGTDNIIISYFLGVVVVGKYGVFISIVNIVITFCNQIFNGITSSIGNFIVEKNSEECFYLYKKLECVTSCFQIFVAVCLSVLLNPFISWWLGEDALLSKNLAFLFSINTFITIMRKPIHVFKTASGLFEKDKYIPLLESILNIVLSLFFVQLLGAEGVLLGTIISSVIFPVITSPYIVYKYLFKKNIVSYFIRQFFNLFVTVITIFILECILKDYLISSFWNLIVQFFVVIVFSIFVVLCVYGKNLYIYFCGQKERK